MNILLLTHFFTIGRGGSWYVIAILAELLAKRGHKVWVITNKLEGFDSPQNENIKTIFVSSQPFGTKRFKLKHLVRYYFSAIKVGLSIIRKEKIDLIHSDPVPALAGSILSLLTFTPHVVVIHDVFSIHKKLWRESLKQKEISKRNAILRPFFEKILIRLKCSAIHTVSEAARDDLIKLGAKKPIYVIHNAIPINKEDAVTTNPFQLVTVSRQTFYKNIQVAIKAVKIVKKSFPKISLVIIGDGPYRKSLEGLVAELDLKGNVIFKGHVSEEEKNTLLSSSQALVFPSLFEGFGMVILEAFAQKKPVLVSDVRPQSDIVEHDKTGLIIPTHNEKEWAKAIEHVLREPEIASRMGHAGRKVLEEKYNLEIMQRRILTMYESVIKK